MKDYKYLVTDKINEGSGYELLTNLEELSEISNTTELTLRDNYTSEVIIRKVKTIIGESFKSSVVRLEENKEHYLHTRGIPNLYPEGTVFYRDPLKSKTWYYVCGDCSKDEYVLNNLCSGVFKMDITHLSAGRKSCRCGKTYKWTLPQRDYQMRSLCKERGQHFIKWVDKSKTSSHCRFEWQCEYGHICEMSVDNYRRGKGCKHCAISTGNGYFPARRHEDDILYVTKINENKTNPKNYFKVGRSFNPSRRMDELRREVKKKDNRDITFYPVVYLFGKHADIFRIEQEVHKVFEDFKPINGYGSSELIHNIAFLDVLDYLKGTGLGMNISETVYLKADHEIKLCEMRGDLEKVVRGIVGSSEASSSDESFKQAFIDYFMNTVWKREFGCGATRETIRGVSVPIVQKNKQTGEIIDYVEGE